MRPAAGKLNHWADGRMTNAITAVKEGRLKVAESARQHGIPA